MDEREPKQKYKFSFLVKEEKKPDTNLQRKKYFDPNNPYQFIMTVLMSKTKSKKN
ncbi:MAG: hypothetical protein WCU90_11350 [Kiritimatiellia bacterium]